MKISSVESFYLPEVAGYQCNLAKPEDMTSHYCNHFHY